ncbi:hypothetical protein TraAM80_07572 [Trypanosoma rangeli]|uniref:Uncharacterized protein n=1 Tax=Trypanosoma rangeli TaxID=5698 RepID=A0A422N4P7_TRYRA|nr:uncharacterized protein TraAM80_07572 [Trypanosoma rangeli]RNF00463.1 hypothetical protein TraAM80_07572 [Trypanosoma rangeli]|eukprot:RNF00463.1 hypothetical protein TraAM80_07572 [Trypanosoma rangeli]
MNRMLVIQMLHSKAMERRMRAECDVVFAEEMGFRELISLEEGFRWEEMLNWAELEVYQLKLALTEQEMLNHFRFNVVGSFGLDKLGEKEMTLHSSIMGLRNRLEQAEKDLNSINSRHTEFLQEKMRKWNNEKEALDLQMEELRIRITRLNQGPDALAPTKSPRSGVVDVTRSRTETPTEGIHISYLTERTKEALSRAQDILS